MAAAATTVFPDPTSPIEEPLHRTARFEIGPDFAQAFLLVRGEPVGQALHERPVEPARIGVTVGRPRLRPDPGGDREGGLQAVELLEDEAASPEGRFLRRLGSMDGPEGFGPRRQAVLFAKVRGERIPPRRQPLEGVPDRAPERPGRHPRNDGVPGNDPLELGLLPLTNDFEPGMEKGGRLSAEGPLQKNPGARFQGFGEVGRVEPKTAGGTGFIRDARVDHGPAPSPPEEFDRFETNVENRRLPFGNVGHFPLLSRQDVLPREEPQKIADRGDPP